MDPLSVTVSVVTLLGAYSTVLEMFKKIREIQQVPDTLYSLNNEIADLKLVLLDIHDCRDEFFRKDPANLSDQEKRLLDRCHGLLELTWSLVREAETLMNSGMQRVTGSGHKSKFKLNALPMLRENERLAVLQVKIREAKHTILSLWGQLNQRHSAQIGVQLNEILERGTAIQNQLHKAIPEVLEGQGRIERKVDKLPEMLQVLSSPSNCLTTRLATNTLNNNRSTKRLDVGLTRVSSTQVAHPYDKPCQCRARTGPFSYVRSFLGDLFLGYAATPMFGKQHNPDCQYSFQTEMVLVYSFPIWFLNYAIALRAKYDATSGLQCTFSARPVLPFYHVVWDLAALGDTKGLQSYLSSKQLPIEVCDSNGNGLLYVSNYSL